MITIAKTNNCPLTFGDLKEGELFCPNTYNAVDDYKHIFLKLANREVGSNNAVWVTNAPGVLCTVERGRLVKLVNAHMEILM